ncbi:hypothetical protein M1E11_25385 (plasmid) [Bacillus sp. JZ8]
MLDIFVKWLRKEGLDVRGDDFESIYGRRKGKMNGGPVMAVSSHLDIQPCSVRYDGVLRVPTALEASRA